MQKKGIESLGAKAVEEKPFDPHSVPSVVSVEEQQRNKEIRGYLAKEGKIPPKSVMDTDVDIDHTRVPQYATRPDTQRDMDVLNKPGEDQVTAVVREFEVGDDTFADLKGVEVTTSEEMRSALKNTYPNGIPADTLEYFESGLRNPGPRVPEDVLMEDNSPKLEGTPKEWRKKLRGLIEGAKEKLGMSERGEQLKDYLVSRTKELDIALAAKIEESFREWGKKYDKKLSRKSKLAIGLGLGVSAGVLSAASLPGVAAVALGGIAAQRVAGLSSAYLKYEKSTPEGKWKKEKAMAKAIVQTAAMTGAMLLLVEGVKEGIDHARQHQWGDAVLDWLKQHYPFGTAEAPTDAHADPSSEFVGKITMAPEAPQPAAAAAAVEASPPAPTVPEMPTVKATPGRGYEYMMKRLWEQLQEKHLDPNQYADGSDIRQLLEADASSIDKAVHQIASDPERGFFKPDGASVRIDLDSRMTINADGNVQLGDVVKAPEGAPEMPPYDPESLVARVNANISPEGTIPTAEAVTNQFGLNVPTAEPHIYADQEAKYLFVYGGSPLERTQTISEYLMKNPSSVVIGTDETGTYRVPWHLVEGKVTAGARMRTNGFLGVFSTWMKPPEPDDFVKIIK